MSARTARTWMPRRGQRQRSAAPRQDEKHRPVRKKHRRHSRSARTRMPSPTRPLAQARGVPRSKWSTGSFRSPSANRSSPRHRRRQPILHAPGSCLALRPSRRPGDIGAVGQNSRLSPTVAAAKQIDMRAFFIRARRGFFVKRTAWRMTPAIDCQDGWHRRVSISSIRLQRRHDSHHRRPGALRAGPFHGRKIGIVPHQAGGHGRTRFDVLPALGRMWPVYESTV